MSDARAWEMIFRALKKCEHELKRNEEGWEAYGEQRENSWLNKEFSSHPPW